MIFFFGRTQNEKAKGEKKRANEIEAVFRKLKTKPWAEDAKVSGEVLDKLREIGQPALEKIIEMSKSDLWPTRREAMEGLGNLAAIEALWLLEDERGEELLIQALKDEADRVRVEAVQSLIMIEEIKKTGKAIPAVIEVLENEKNPDIRVDTAMMLAFLKWDPRVIKALFQALYDKERPPKPESLFPTFGYSGDPMTVQDMAALSLAKIGVTKEVVAEYFTQGLRVQSWEGRGPKSENEMQERANEILAYCNEYGIGDEQPVKPLIHALKDRDRKVRMGAVEALGNKKDMKVVEFLAQALNDEDELVRMKAAEALGKKEDPPVELFIRALKDEDVGCRQNAAIILGDIGDARAVEALTQAKEDKSWFVRSAANAALKKIKAKEG